MSECKQCGGWKSDQTPTNRPCEMCESFDSALSNERTLLTQIRALEAEVARLREDLDDTITSEAVVAEVKRLTIEAAAKAVDTAIQFVRDGKPGWLGVVSAHDALRAAIEGSKTI